MPQDHRYLFALMPPTELSAKIDALRCDVAETYNCRKALKPPVHITLYTVFEAAREEEQKLTSLHEWASYQQPIEVQLQDFGFFEKGRHPVLFVDVVKNPALRAFNIALVAQVKKLLPELIGVNTRDFHPHFTLAYRDTSLEIFPAMKAEYSRRKFSAEFIADSFYLWRHNTRNWEVIQEFQFGTGLRQAALF